MGKGTAESSLEALRTAEGPGPWLWLCNTGDDPARLATAPYRPLERSRESPHTHTPSQALPWSAVTYHALGLAHEAAGRPEAAHEAYRTALGLDPRHAPSLLRLGGRTRAAG